ncbi:cupredoxin domain-containing protein [Streptomyces ficellus]|uniref:Cupredoxin domain-containing protein n=1 Tax=Streptomyces ficellus TaxID=1977088 RepID=A0ABT7YZF1_9ACTN|nr:cupredoxin domain-containing protein [Streptomyces ficellus]MDN3292585.1 cupredoxin domain-containing protein [Streptomyces ficellus]
MLYRPLRPHSALAAVALCMLTAVTACSNGEGSAPAASRPATSASSPPAGKKEARITVKDFAFKPANLTVSPGTTVTVINQDSAPHTVTAGSGGKPFDTGTIAAGESATFAAPSSAGKYSYICDIHPFMKGSLTVR